MKNSNLDPDSNLNGLFIFGCGSFKTFGSFWIRIWIWIPNTLLNKHWSQGTEVRPPSLNSPELNLLKYLMCGVRSMDINSSSSKTNGP